MTHSASRRVSGWIFLLVGAIAWVPAPAAAQAIRGRLLDASSGRPIDLGLVVLFTEDGDSIGFTVTEPDGRFSIAAPDPGTFLLRASAWGFSEREEGVFELGDGGQIDIEFRIPPVAMELEEILVSVQGRPLDHPLVQNGFVSRYQRGFGHFITPRDLERSLYSDTESLFHMIPGVHVVPSRDSYATGELVLMRSARGGRCRPTLFVDGVRTTYRPDTGESLSLVAPVRWIAAVEVYRRPAEVPLQYGGVMQNCGVIVIWMKQ